jgi:hypothetical protein
VPNELQFNEAEANEILRTAVRIAAPDKISRDELAIAAAQLGIKPEDLAEAEAKHERLKTEQGERDEFHRLQVQNCKNWLFYALGFWAIEASIMIPKHWFFTLAIFSAVVIVWQLVASFRMLSPSSKRYKERFSEWRQLRTVRLAPERRQGVVEGILADQLQKHGTTSYFRLRFAVKKAMNCDWTRAAEAIDELLAREPSLRAKVSGAK